MPVGRNKGLELVISGDASGALNALESVEGRASGTGDKLARFGRAAGAAFAAVGVAAAGAAAVSLAKFQEFEQGMNEVFTLVPGASEQAMGQMTDQVKDFATEFGVLPDEVIPALYQSLSAGVPEGGVFDFLESAQKFSRGAVTELTSSVDLLSSVVNAYGEDAISAQEASDLLFTTIRLGKTTGPELASSLSNVTPVAAAMGLEFGNVTAAIATMTAQGTQTAQATTQIRQMLIELADAGTEAGQAFEGVAGKSFRDFISGGGDLGQALDLMSQAAADAGVPVEQLFGSVEAGLAALQLSGPNAAGFAENIAAMGDAAGATDDAYERMVDSTAFVMDKLRAIIQVGIIDVGEKVAEFARPLLELAADVHEAFGEDGIAGAFDLLSERSGFFAAIRPALDAVVEGLDGMGGQLAIVLGAAGLGALVAVVGAVIAGMSAVTAIILGVAAAIGLLVAGVVYAYNEWEGFRNAVDAVVGFFTGTVRPALEDFASFVGEQFANLSAWVAEHWDEISEAVGHVVNVIRATVATGITAVLRIWQYVGDDIMGIVSAAWNFISRTIENAVAFIGGVIELGLAIINGDWGAAWEALKGIFSTAWDQLLNVVRFAWEQVKGIFGGAISQVQMLWSGGWAALQQLLSAAWQAIVGVLDFQFGWIVDLIGGFASTVWGLWSGLWNGVTDFTGRALGFVVGVVRSQIDAIKRAFQLGVDAIGRVWGGLKSVFSSVANWVIDNVINRFIGAVNQIADRIGINLRLPPLGNVGGSGYSVRGGAGPEGAIGPRYHSGGVVAGVGEQPATLLGGEGVLPVEIMRKMGREQFELLRAGKTDAIGDGFGISAIGDALASAGSFVADRVRDVVANVARPAVEAALSMLDRVAPGVPGQLFAGMARNVGEGVLDWVDGAGREAEKYAVPALSPGIGWEAMWRAVQGRFPNAWKSSDFRPGSITKTGNQSYHALGRAIDFGIGGTPNAATMGLFNWLHDSYMSVLKELIYSPAGGRQVHNGRHHMYTGVTRADHWDHIHMAMDEGGAWSTTGRPTRMVIDSKVPETFYAIPHSRRSIGSPAPVHVHLEGAVITDGPEGVLRLLEEAANTGRGLGPGTRRLLGVG